MKYFLPFLLLFPFLTRAQTIKICIKNETTRQSIPGATIEIDRLKLSATSNDSGQYFFKNIPTGKQLIEVSSIGYKKTAKFVVFPPASANELIFFLVPDAKELNEVIISSTRSNRSIKNTPTRIEVIEGEEVQEEATMRPGDIRMLLSESTGIQTQQTSATSANASIRIQGLDGRYTQILKDGFPIYAGAASGLGLLQTPPLDLRQVEIIKGASSTLYGGGAIAGLINLITKIPTAKKELNVNLNATTGGGIDLSGFYGEKFKRTGVTLFVSRNSNNAYDPANNIFSAIPKFERYTFNPKLFLYLGQKTTINFGINTTVENRLGGDMLFIAGKGDSSHSYFERNKTQRFATQLSFNHKINNNSTLTIKNSAGYFNRIINSNGYSFNGTQYSSFSEASYINKRPASDWVIGANALTDQFKEIPETTVPVRDYQQNTVGIFVQNTWNATSWLTLETGLRYDYVNGYGGALLPRISTLFKIAPGFTSRIGAGFGYKPPTIFTEETEKLLYKNILPVRVSQNKMERSYGANWDVNYKIKLDKFTLSFNQFFFFTYLNNPLSLVAVQNNLLQLQNSSGHISTKGAETNIKIGLGELALYLGYTYTDAKLHSNGSITQKPLTPKHRLNAALVYEVEGKWKFGSEAYYFSKQALTDGLTGRDYWLTGLVAEKLWRHFSVFINFENFGDVRQTKFENIYTGTITNPVFKDIYTPLEGFVVNGGIKIKL